MVSHYWWNGAVERGEEVVMIIKTRASLSAQVSACREGDALVFDPGHPGAADRERRADLSELDIGRDQGGGRGGVASFQTAARPALISPWSSILEANRVEANASQPVCFTAPGAPSFTCPLVRGGAERRDGARCLRGTVACITHAWTHRRKTQSAKLDCFGVPRPLRSGRSASRRSTAAFLEPVAPVGVLAALARWSRTTAVGTAPGSAFRNVSRRRPSMSRDAM